MHLVVAKVGHHSITIGIGNPRLRSVFGFVPLSARSGAWAPLRPLCFHRRDRRSPCILLPRT